MESIGRGGTLKERMAALQGKGGFGGAPPPIPSKPMEKPKWKPPPMVSPPADEDEKEFVAGAGGREASRSPPPRAVASSSAESQETSNREGDPAAEEGGDDPDAEEEARQRRATIAARMARLGGARFGMGPPIFAPKPVARKSEPTPSAPEVQEEAPHTDQTTVLGESREAFVASPPQDLPASTSAGDEAIAESGSRDEAAPGRAPASMPVPAAPRRAAPPRKKAYKSSPAALLPPAPTEGAEGEASQPPPSITDEPPAPITESLSVTPADELLATSDVQKEIGEVNKSVEASYDEHLNIKQDVEQLPHVPTKESHESDEEPEQQEAEEEPVEPQEADADEEPVHTAADDEHAPVTGAPEVEEEEEEEARRKRVAAKLAQMGAFNPMAGPPPIPRLKSLDEKPETEESLEVENEVDVDTEEVGKTPPPPSAVPARKHTAESIKHEDAELHVETQEDNSGVDEDEAMPTNRDDELAPTSEAEEESLAHRIFYHRTGGDVYEKNDEHTHSPGFSQQPQTERSISGSADLPVSQLHIEHTQKGYIEQSTVLTDPDQVVASTSTGFPAAGIEENEEKTADDDEMPPPRITRPIPPPPVNFSSKPISPTSPTLSSPPARTSLQVLRADEEERPASPAPRPVPPPGRSIPDPVAEEAPSAPPRRSLPPPPRRTSFKITDPQSEVPCTPPPAPTSPRPVSRRPTTPPIITAVTLEQEPEETEEYEGRVVEEQALSGPAASEPEAADDEESTRRRTIAERMARLGGIRFGALPSMNPLSRPPLPAAPPPTSVPPDDSELEVEEQARDEEDEDEAARKLRIAAKLANMGGMRIGMLPPPAGLPPASVRTLVSKQEDSESEDATPPVPVPAPPQRAPSTRRLPPPVEVPVAQRPEQRGRLSSDASDDGVQVEADESEIEEVNYSDADVPPTSAEVEEAPTLPPPRRSSAVLRSIEALPTPPPRMTSRSPPPGRPPIPSIPAALLNRRPSVATSSPSSSRKTSVDESSAGETPTVVHRADSYYPPQSEYVMVEADPDSEEAPTPPPRRKSTRGPARSLPLPPPPPPSAIDPPEELASSRQWELPSIPQGVELGESDLASSGWSQDSTIVHAPPPVLSNPSSRRPSLQLAPSLGPRSIDQQLTTDELMTLWGKVGVQVVESATTLFDKSKRSLVGDGSYAGFVRAVLAQVPEVHMIPAASGNEEWGYVIYVQTGGAVQRRVSDIMPGDIISFWDAKLKGHKGLHAYNQTVGNGRSGPLVGVVSEFDARKSKVRVWQANQHVGQQVSLFRRFARKKNGALTPRATQTVENVSYRLEDLKSGHVKVFRALEA
ncbi:hypothetical protein PAXINDRAFT_173234 [Paxillus involutus ATCC 200175]|uniref:BBC1/AIM3 cysteine proteinase-fold domain-containing protein n=1 Tax=Paxillus involutus ATCC 200175 TaxID=664439 RepID=A0A0C9TKE2_PAXIN|nr:hypothetical protein PAXINDRAFT_173234 [Paxillus involutus ATCC 200175]